MRLNYRCLVKIIAPDAANMPPTPWRAEILAFFTCAGRNAAHLPHALLERI
jgi:hypothetical protein